MARQPMEMNWDALLTQQVRVYRDLTLGRTAGWMAVKAKLEGGWKTVANARNLVLRDVTFQFSPSLLRQAKALNQRTPHLWGFGTLVAESLPAAVAPDLAEITYNFREHQSFVTREGLHPVHSCSYLVIVNGTAWVDVEAIVI